MKQIIPSLIILLIYLAAAPAAYARLETEVVQSGALLSHRESVDPRIQVLESYLIRKNSALAAVSGHIVKEADRLSLDWRMIAAIAGLESSFCKRIPAGSYNCWGWGIPTGSSAGLGFDSYADGVSRVSEGLREKYYDRGLTTLEQVGRVYAASPTWASRVRFIMDDISLNKADPIDRVTVYL